MQRARGPDLPWLSLFLTALGVLFTLLPECAIAGLELDRHHVVEGEYWRLWTGHLVHFSWRHAAVDLTAFLLIGMSIEARYGAVMCLGGMLLAMPAISFALLQVAPDLQQYRGASGLCALYAAALWSVLWLNSHRWRPGLLLLGFCFTIKTSVEAFGMPLNASRLSGSIAVVWQVHIVGAALGICWIFWFERCSWFHRRPNDESRKS